MNGIPTLKQIFDNPDAVASLLFCVAAIIGQLAHGVKKALEGEVSCVEWFRHDFRRTLAAMIGNGMGMIVFIQTDVLGPMLALGPKGFFAIVLFGLSNGFSSDSALNKTTRTADKPAP